MFVMQKMTTTEKRVAVGSLGYQIIQEIKNLRLLKGYSQAYVAKEIGVSKRQMGRYEEGRDSLSPKKFEDILKVLSIDVEATFSKLIKENCINSKDEKALSVVQNFKKFKDQEFRNALCVLVKILSEGTQINKSITGTKPLSYKIRQKLKDWRFVRVRTQTDLGDKAGLSPQQIQRYEQGVNDISFNKISEMEKALSLSNGALLPRSKDEIYYEDEDTEGEKKVLSFMRGYQNIRNERLQNTICSFLSEIAEICEEEQTL
ncbi:transcriptional regulator [Wolbachia endosymbiont of Delia radicum]|uniref:helix-turn-helix transcriptional regulator n=1 Tax=unclassified Wolbachia TaxID=2640676 RepID=UPI001F43FB4B|nr:MULTISPECIES: helix-turn-helix transcriptional regulator [unclassified Wolbachia]UJQ20674.1 transcriptional regulator [Wolbachia endosymbiont of Delia radicum]